MFAPEQFHFQFIFGYELKTAGRSKITKESVAIQADCWKDVNKISFFPPFVCTFPLDSPLWLPHPHTHLGSLASSATFEQPEADAEEEQQFSLGCRAVQELSSNCENILSWYMHECRAVQKWSTNYEYMLSRYECRAVQKLSTNYEYMLSRYMHECRAVCKAKTIGNELNVAKFLTL